MQGTETVAEVHDELIRAVLNGALDRFPNWKKYRYFVDAIRLSIGKAPLYMSDQRSWGYRHADEVDLPYDGPEEIVVRETNYVRGVGNAAAPRVARGPRAA